MRLSYFRLSLAVCLLLSQACSQVDTYDIENRPFSFEQHQGEWVVLSYWAPWCNTCTQEITHLNELYHQYKDKGLNLYAVSIEPMPLDEQIRQRAKWGIQYPQLRTNPGEQYEFPPVEGVPTMAIIHPNGDLLPYETGGQLSQKIQALLNLNKDSAMTAMSRHFYVSGKVQGVFFRASTKEEAERLKLTGWVKNLPDGRVEVLATGTQEQLDELESWLQEGPATAKVSEVVAKPESYQAFNQFEVTG